MAKKNRKRYDSSFKIKIVLEALKEQKTLAQLSSEFGISASQISNWKQEILSAMPSLFGKEKRPLNVQEEEDLTAPLYQQIGQLKVENEYLKKKLRQLSIPSLRNRKET